MEHTTVIIGLGTNIGNRQHNLRAALDRISKYIEIEKTSSIYETQPVDYEHQTWFLNMVVQGTTEIPPNKLLAMLQETESAMGRKPTISKGPRIIDLDILFYSDEVLSSKNLTIPHPEIQNRRFVLMPLSEISPGFLHPKLNKTIKNMLNNFKHDQQVSLWIEKK